MARAFRIFAALVALIGFGWSQAHAQVPMTGAGRGAPTVVAAGVTAVDSGAASLCASGTSCNYTNLTVSAALPNSALGVFIINSDNGSGVTGLSATWDSGGTNQGMTQLATFVTGNFQSWLFGSLAPTAGNKTLALSWTGTAQLFVCAVSLKNVKQTSVATAFVNSNSSGANVSTASVTVTSQVNDLVITVFDTSDTWTSTGGSQICLNNAGSINSITASSDAGAASVAATATGPNSAPRTALGIDVVHN